MLKKLNTMKQILTCLFSFTVIAFLASCGNSNDSAKNQDAPSAEVNASEPVVEAIEKTEAAESTENQNITDQGVGSNSNPGANIQDNSNAPARQEATKPAENNTNKPRGENASKDKDGITTTGQEIIDSMTSKLDSKLSLSAEQNKSISQILQKSLTDSGLSLSGEYTHEKSRTIGQDLIKNSSQAIAKVLDKDQSERFKKFRNK